MEQELENQGWMVSQITHDAEENQGRMGSELCLVGSTFKAYDLAWSPFIFYCM